MSRQLSLSAALAAGAVALGMGLSGVPTLAATKSTTAHRTTTTPARAPHIAAGFHGARTSSGADFVVGVDAPTPAGWNLQYTDYFPRTALTVNPGQVIDFTWDPALSPDSFHTATLLPVGTTPQNDSTNFPPVQPEVGGDTPETPALYSQFLTFASTNPPPGSGAPGACGDPTTPCNFDGSGVLSSGGNGAGSDFFVKITYAPSSPTSITFHCRVHPGMHGSLTVAPLPAAHSNPTALAADVASQWQSDTDGILAAIDGADHGAYVTNPDGSHHVTITAGVGTQFAEALEMLPRDVRVAPGDSLTWVVRSQAEIHTVTFPNGHGSDSVDPFNFAPVCETPGPPDAAANLAGPPNTWCSSGLLSDIEFPFDPAPHGPTTISSASTVASSGVLADFPGSPFPNNYTFSFSSTGVLHYQCRVHDHMRGTIFVAPSPGYWNVAGDGGVFAHGMAQFGGSMGGTRLNKPVVGISTTPDVGYVLAASDGGIFALGDATFHGSMGGTTLNKPVVGVSETPSGNGYRMVASDGGIFNFGDAGFSGSMGATKLNAPMVGIASTPSGLGYWLVASDGGVFAFGDAGFHGSMGGTTLNKPVVGIASDLGGLGYWLTASDGGIFALGDASFHGSDAGSPLNSPVVGIAAQ